MVRPSVTTAPALLVALGGPGSDNNKDRVIPSHHCLLPLVYPLLRQRLLFPGVSSLILRPLLTRIQSSLTRQILGFLVQLESGLEVILVALVLVVPGI